VRKYTGGIAEGTICYTGDFRNTDQKKYTLDYYLQMAKDLENAGAHIIGLKDMAGLLKPDAAYELVQALRDTVALPVHLHTHDTSSIQTATYLKAIEAGVDVVDVALGGLSGLTSQPNFNSVVEMIRHHPRERQMNAESLAEHSRYWETMRSYYFPFESGLKSGTGEVYTHEIPGGQYSNLKGQAIALGLEDKFPEVTKMYAEVNKLFGDIIKVTPSSKVVGDMAQYLISNGITADEVLTKGQNIAFPDSVKSFFRGDLGQPLGGFNADLQKVILKDEKPYTDRPNAHIAALDIEKEFKKFKRKFSAGMGRDLEITDFLSYQLYPKVFESAYQHHLKFGNVVVIPTKNFFYGMKIGEEILVTIEKGKNVLVQLQLVGKPDENGMVDLFFKINGQLSHIRVKDQSIVTESVQNQKADADNDQHVGSPLQGLLSNILVKKGQTIKANTPLFVLEAMKMETTVTAPKEGTVKEIVLKAGTLVESDDLIIVLED